MPGLHAFAARAAPYADIPAVYIRFDGSYMDEMTTRSKILVALVLVFAGATALYVWQRYNLHFFPRDVCYTRGGAVVGSQKPHDGTHCFGDDMTVFEERSLGGVHGPVRNDSHQVCLHVCQRYEWCSHYIFHLPIEYYDGDGIISTQAPESFACSLLKEHAR